MSHWLDDAARGLADGTHSRREVLRRGGAVAGGAVLASVTSPFRPLTRAAAASGSGVPCPTVPCLAPDACCGGNKCCNSNQTCCEGECLEDGGRVGCCGGRQYPRAKATCCGGRRCNSVGSNATHLCCEGMCLKRSGRIGCCDNRPYDRITQICCPRDAGGGPGHKCKNGHKCCGNRCCDKREECCGKSACCKKGERCCGMSCCTKGEQCCNSGKLRYCAPTGKCCPRGQHRVTCGGKAKSMCCPEGEYCCGGKCCKASNCIDGVCRKECPPFSEAQMCFGTCNCPSTFKCCDGGDCSGNVGQGVCCTATGSFIPSSNFTACCMGGQGGIVCGGVCCTTNFCCGGPAGTDHCCAPGQGCCDSNGMCGVCSDIRLKRDVQTLSGNRPRF